MVRIPYGILSWRQFAGLCAFFVLCLFPDSSLFAQIQLAKEHVYLGEKVLAVESAGITSGSCTYISLSAYWKLVPYQGASNQTFWVTSP